MINRIIIMGVSVFPVISNAASGTLDNPLKAKSFVELINALLSIVVMIGTPIAALFFVYAGFMFVTAQGEPKKLETAKSMFWWTVIGTAIIVGAEIILVVLTSTVGDILK